MPWDWWLSTLDWYWVDERVEAEMMELSSLTFQDLRLLVTLELKFDSRVLPLLVDLKVKCLASTTTDDLSVVVYVLQMQLIQDPFLIFQFILFFISSFLLFHSRSGFSLLFSIFLLFFDDFRSRVTHTNTQQNAHEYIRRLLRDLGFKDQNRYSFRCLEVTSISSFDDEKDPQERWWSRRRVKRRMSLFFFFLQNWMMIKITSKDDVDGMIGSNTEFETRQLLYHLFFGLSNLTSFRFCETTANRTTISPSIWSTEVKQVLADEVSSERTGVFSSLETQEILLPSCECIFVLLTLKYRDDDEE